MLVVSLFQDTFAFFQALNPKILISTTISVIREKKKSEWIILRSQGNKNNISKASIILANILLQVLPTPHTDRDRKFFIYHKDGCQVGEIYSHLVYGNPNIFNILAMCILI